MNAAQAEADIPYQVLYICGRFAEKEQQEGFAVKRKNLPPMM